MVLVYPSRLCRIYIPALVIWGMAVIFVTGLGVTHLYLPSGAFYRPAWLPMTKIWIYKTQMGARREVLKGMGKNGQPSRFPVGKD